MTRCALVADAGGTNVRFALVDLDTAVALLQPRKFASREFASLEAAARQYLDGAGAKPSLAVLAVAGPVRDGHVELTNLGWRVSADGVGRALGIASVELINDFEAIALSIPHLGAADRVDIGPAVEGEQGGAVAVAGPGTGFGVAGLVHGAVLVTEGGHVDFAPADDVEIRILEFLRRRFGHVSVERILSGPGLVNLHAAMAAIGTVAYEKLSPREITARAEADPASLCAAVFARFCAILGSVAGDIALTMGARGGVMLAGGILPAMIAPLQASAFRERFEAKGRFAGYMKAIPTRLIVQDRAGVLGAAARSWAMTHC